jgi:hypothetical protein
MLIPGSLRSWVVAGRVGDEVMWAVVGASGGSGDVGIAVGVVVADRGVAEGCHDCWAVTGSGLVEVFKERDIADVDPVFDQPLAAGPVLQKRLASPRQHSSCVDIRSSCHPDRFIVQIQALRIVETERIP